MPAGPRRSPTRSPLPRKHRLAMSEHKTLGRREAFVDVAINSRITSMTMNLTYWTPRMLSVLRIVTGLLFLEHGTEKLLCFPVSPNPGPVLFSLLGIQGIL